MTPGAEQNGDSITIVPALLPVSSRLNIDVTVRVPGTSDFKKNAAVIFDYRSPTDFKFVSLHFGDRSLRIGQRDATKWNFLERRTLRPEKLATDTDIDLRVAVDEGRVEARMNGNILAAHIFGSSVNLGSVGLGSKNGKTLFEALVLALRNAALYEDTYGVPATVAGDLDQDGDTDFDDIEPFRLLLGSGSKPAAARTADFAGLVGIVPGLGQSGARVGDAFKSGSATAERLESVTARSGPDRQPALVSAVFAEKESVDSLVAALRKPAVAKARRSAPAAPVSDGDQDGDGDLDEANAGVRHLFRI